MLPQDSPLLLEFAVGTCCRSILVPFPEWVGSLGFELCLVFEVLLAVLVYDLVFLGFVD